MGSCNETIDSANKGIDGIWEGRALSRPFYMAATERCPPNISPPFVAETIDASGILLRRLDARGEKLDELGAIGAERVEGR